MVDVARRNQCQFCRFQKCLQTKMRREGEQWPGQYFVIETTHHRFRFALESSEVWTSFSDISFFYLLSLPSIKSLQIAVQHERVTGVSGLRGRRLKSTPNNFLPPVSADSTTASIVPPTITFPRQSQQPLAMPTPLTPWANWFSYQNSINSSSEDILNYSRLYFGVGM